MQENEKSPLVSIIMPIYNTDKYLTEALDAILMQTYKNWELIAINDGSTDDSLRILESYAQKDSRIHIKTQENQGMVKATQKALQQSKGYYIAFADADDMMRPNRLAVQVGFLQKRPDIDVVGSGFEVLEQESKIQHNPGFFLYTHGLKLSAFYKMMIPTAYAPPVHHPTVMMKRHVWADNPHYFRKIPKTLKNCPSSIDKGAFGDVYFYMLLILKGYEITCIPDVLYVYRRSTQSLLHAQKKELQKYSFGYLTNVYVRLFFGSQYKINKAVFEFLSGDKMLDIKDDVAIVLDDIISYLNAYREKKQDSSAGYRMVLDNIIKCYGIYSRRIAEWHRKKNVINPMEDEGMIGVYARMMSDIQKLMDRTIIIKEIDNIKDVVQSMNGMLYEILATYAQNVYKNNYVELPLPRIKPPQNQGGIQKVEIA